MKCKVIVHVVCKTHIGIMKYGMCNSVRDAYWNDKLVCNVLRLNGQNGDDLTYQQFRRERSCSLCLVVFVHLPEGRGFIRVCAGCVGSSWQHQAT